MVDLSPRFEKELQFFENVFGKGQSRSESIPQIIGESEGVLKMKVLLSSKVLA